jgi:hypothetical protein
MSKTSQKNYLTGWNILFNNIANKTTARLENDKLVATYKIEPNLIPPLPFAISCEALCDKL